MLGSDLHPDEEAGEQVFESATSLLRSCDPWRRARGADILGQFQQDAKTSERFDTLSAALEIEKDDRTLTSLIYAISQLQDERILPKYLDHAAHPKPEVRLAVAMSINPN